MEIVFKYSKQLEERLNPGASLVPIQNIHTKLKELEAFWMESGSSIQIFLKKITGFDFKEVKIFCYLNTGYSFSDPLTIKMEDSQRMKDNLVHELIHQLFIQNNIPGTLFEEKWKKYWQAFPEEHSIVKSHVLLHSIHYLLAKELFDRDISFDSKREAYVRSWQIVMEKGPKNIIDTFLS